MAFFITTREEINYLSYKCDCTEENIPLDPTIPRIEIPTKFCLVCHKPMLWEFK